LAKFNIKSIGYAKGEKNRSVTVAGESNMPRQIALGFWGLKKGNNRNRKIYVG